MTPRNGPFKQVMGVGWVRLGKIYQYICQVKKKHTVSHCCKNNATKVKKKKKISSSGVQNKILEPPNNLTPSPGLPG